MKLISGLSVRLGHRPSRIIAILTSVTNKCKIYHFVKGTKCTYHFSSRKSDIVERIYHFSSGKSDIVG